MEPTLKVNEIFLSLQGEGARTGLPCVLVRLAGCNLRCRWCDTAYAWDEGRDMTLPAILGQVAQFGCPRVELTGGEPLLQPAAADLLQRFCQTGYETLVETNGSLDISALDERIARILDIKCPSSGHCHANRWDNLRCLRPRDEVKFVIAGRGDYDYARSVVQEHRLTGRAAIVFSPVREALEPSTLAEWILADKIDVRLGLQLHKILWPDKDRGV